MHIYDAGRRHRLSRQDTLMYAGLTTPPCRQSKEARSQQKLHFVHLYMYYSKFLGFPSFYTAAVAGLVKGMPILSCVVNVSACSGCGQVKLCLQTSTRNSFLGTIVKRQFRLPFAWLFSRIFTPSLASTCSFNSV